jgi:hypothetical protein
MLFVTRNFLEDMALVMCVAALAAVLCQALRQPLVVGYLIAVNPRFNSSSYRGSPRNAKPAVPPPLRRHRSDRFSHYSLYWFLDGFCAGGPDLLPGNPGILLVSWVVPLD